MIALILAAALSTNAGLAKTSDRPLAPALQPIAYAASAAPAPVLAGVAVTLECTAHTDGRVGECSVLGETHPGMGFGAAAIALVEGTEVEPGPEPVQFARTIQFMP
ncbi:hypothetical protein BZG35_17375 [Brevundimonas sp. LM2]|uniref:energy transducer TonB n=1 Tax=Brevundimonas sp. LM2 TaxID=1938605 RepID=UPI000983B8F4|nr:energy transducer TonB [Brevundimonas sp. LM2]AQR63219.1 hypothetical protein BZG35_17375 [Brevundimonas sp. LM2]